MYHNLIYNDISEALPSLLAILDASGKGTPSRNGECREITHVGITLTDPVRREVLVPGRKVNLAAQIAETMWVLGGRDDMEFLSHYLPRARDFSDDGETWRAGYGRRLRHWEGFQRGAEFDQFAECYRLLKEDPLTRRAVMSIWDPALDYAESKDIPCNNWLSWSCRGGVLDLMVAIRSNDIIWGWSGINAFEWSAMLEVMAGLLGVRVGSLHFATTSLHLYEPHWAKSKTIQERVDKEGLGTGKRILFRVPDLSGDPLRHFDDLVARWFVLEEQIRTGSVPKVEVSRAVNAFPEPMLRSWLWVIQWWWGQKQDVEMIDNQFRLGRAMRDYSMQPPDRQPAPSGFVKALCALHLDKERSYGGSWMKRGEMFSIMPNIGRKIDRLGTGGETADENQADTAGDLFVYLAKYRTWLDLGSACVAAHANDVMKRVERETLTFPDGDVGEWKRDLDKVYEDLLAEVAIGGKHDDKIALVETMLPVAYRLARTLGEDEYRGADVD